ncbi:hypothetical protein niasHT_015433 [Heterodera trifolii]|uniref:DNA mismatch repair proteins mutS family domain-containing protein n=1 Tax=Heterodera trifolii TaxID=157864 RepID=A0ABD2L017_9BILA
MSRAIAKSDENSLLIIDEFGKGTMTEVGLALLASCLNYWLEGPVERCPHVFVSSHFHALSNLLRDPSKLLRFQTMDVRRLDDDTLDFQYSLVDGTIDLSYATFTAFKMGIPRDIVERSEEVYIHLRASGALSELAPIDVHTAVKTQGTDVFVGEAYDGINNSKRISDEQNGIEKEEEEEYDDEEEETEGEKEDRKFATI